MQRADSTFEAFLENKPCLEILLNWIGIVQEKCQSGWKQNQSFLLDVDFQARQGKVNLYNNWKMIETLSFLIKLDEQEITF